jgi:molybdate transport system substrate-binding protein
MPVAKRLKILSGGAMRPLLVELAPRFEQAYGGRLDIEFRLTSALKQTIEAGAAFDIAVLPRPELYALVAYGAIAPSSTADVAHSTVGLAVQAGARKPDIGSVVALRQTLQRAGSIAYSDGPSGAYVAELLTNLGLAEEMAAKTKLTNGPVAELVARGEAELGMQQIVAILPVEGRRLGGSAPGRTTKRHYLCRRDVVSLRQSGAGRRLDCVYPNRRGEAVDACRRVGVPVKGNGCR